ncbi:MAG: helix-turn-helix domain-containing protein [Propionibacteriaceae bacterium]
MQASSLQKGAPVFMPPTRERRYASLSDAAEYAACNERTLRKHIISGDLTGYRLGRVYRIDLNELDAWMASAYTPKAG